MGISPGGWPLVAGRSPLMILVAGSLNVDFSVRVPHLAAHGEKL
jgi:hypothetical protein